MIIEYMYSTLYMYTYANTHFSGDREILIRATRDMDTEMLGERSRESERVMDGKKTIR